MAKKKAGVELDLYADAKLAGMDCKAKGKSGVLFRPRHGRWELEVKHTANVISELVGAVLVDGKAIPGRVVTELKAGDSIRMVPKAKIDVVEIEVPVHSVQPVETEKKPAQADPIVEALTNQVFEDVEGYLALQMARRQDGFKRFIRTLSKQETNLPEALSRHLGGSLEASPWTKEKLIEQAMRAIRAVFDELKEASGRERKEMEGRVDAFLAGPTLTALAFLLGAETDGVERSVLSAEDFAKVERCEVYTDGSCDPNPGPGGWAFVVLVDAKVVHEERGTEEGTTNNRMELTAAIKALEFVPPAVAVSIHSDAKYLRDGISSWVPRWRANGWKTSVGSPVQNKDLWERLASLAAGRRVEWSWVRGHDGHKHNELADELAGGRKAPRATVA